MNFLENDPSVSEMIQQLCGILDVNSFELRSPGGMDGLLLRGLYLEASMMAHDCRGNVHVTADDNFHLTVYASIPIKEGDTIFFNYTSSLLVRLFVFIFMLRKNRNSIHKIVKRYLKK